MYKKFKRYGVRITTLLMIGGCVFFSLTMVANAADKDKNVVGFNYKMTYPENQINGSNGYFDLELESGKEQTVTIELSNEGKEKITVNISINGTKTNSNGVIEYGPTDIKNDPSLKFPFEKVVSAPEKVDIPAEGSKTVPITIKMPETSFEGIILGGIHMKKEEDVEVKPVKGATVKNSYSYIVAMRLQNNQEKVLPDINFNQAIGAQRNFRNSVAIKLSNVTSSLVNNKLDIESQITKKGSQEILYERKQTGMSIAPNSQMDFYVSMGGEQMVPGDYSAKMLATIGDEQWEEKLDFTITKEEADKYNKRDVGLVQDRGLDWKLIAMIVGGFLGLVVIIFIVIKVIQRNKKNKSNHSNKKSRTKKRRQ